jgi:rhodanese-related sulfurtransferase
MKNLIMLLAVTFSFAMVNAQESTVKKSENAQSVATKASCSKDAKKTCTKGAKKECTKSANAKKSCSKEASATKCSGEKTEKKACCSKDAAKSASTAKSCSKGTTKSCAKTCGGGSAAYKKLVSPQDFKAYMDRFPAEQVGDLRTKGEIKQNGMIDGAKNIDFKASYFKEEMGKLDRNAAIMVYCKSGNRSGKAVPMLQEMGFKKIYDLDGGYNAYLASDLK